MNEQQIEEQLQQAGASEIRLTPALIDSVIVGAQYHVFEGTTVTVCLLHLRNGAKVTGTNYGSIDPSNFNAEMGKSEAYAQAREKIWELEGYVLRESLSQTAAQVPGN